MTVCEEMGAWAAGLGAWEVAVATGLAWFVFWAGFPSALWRTGLFAFVSASAGVGLLLGLWVRFDRRGSRPGWVSMAAFGSVAIVGLMRRRNRR